VVAEGVNNIREQATCTAALGWGFFTVFSESFMQQNLLQSERLNCLGSGSEFRTLKGGFSSSNLPDSPRYYPVSKMDFSVSGRHVRGWIK